MIRYPQEPVRILSNGQEIIGTITEHDSLAGMMTVATDEGEILVSLMGAIIVPVRVWNLRRMRENAERQKICKEAREEAKKAHESAWEEGKKDFYEDFCESPKDKRWFWPF